MFSRYFRPFVPGFRVGPQDDVPGFNLDENSSPRVGTWPYAMPSRPVAPRYPAAAQALAQPILGFPTPRSDFLAQSVLPIGLAQFVAGRQDDVPGFNIRLEDAVPGFDLVENGSGVPRQKMLWPDRTPESPQYSDITPVPPRVEGLTQRVPPWLPEWLYKVVTMPIPQLSTAFDPQTGRRVVPYAPLINENGTYPTIGQNEHMFGSTRAYVEGTSAPPDLSSVSAPSAEEWPSSDADEWPSSDTEEWPPSDAGEWPSSDEEWPSSETEGQSQAPSTAPSRAPSPQGQPATWETQLPRPMGSPLYSEARGKQNLEDPRSVLVARLPSGLAPPSIRPITDNNFILANARDDAMQQHASANSGSYFGRESVYRIGPNDARLRTDVPANTGIRNSVIASFGYPAAPANTAHQSGTSAALLTPFEYRGQPFNAEVNGRYSRHNPPVHLTANTQETTSTSPSMSDAYPEPLIPGAQYAQVIQQNNAILRNPRIDRTTERLLSILTETVESLGAGSGPIFGIQAHFEFAKRVRALNIPGIRKAGVEQSFDLGAVVRYGLDGSVRTDIVLRDRSGIPIAVYDLKTGNAKLTPSRVQELRNAVGRQDIPVIELRYVSESAILR